MKSIFIFCLLSAVLGCAGQPSKETALYPIQMELKGDTPFAPESIGSFKRKDCFLIKEGTSDNAVTYEIKAAPKVAVAQRFLYEAESTDSDSLEQEFKNVKSVIENLQKTSALVTEKPITFNNNGEVRAGYWSLHGIRADLNGSAFSSYTETYMFKVKDKFIKFRISYPAGQREVLQAEIRHLVQALVWVEIA